jgi:hypothetical protein
MYEPKCQRRRTGITYVLILYVGNCKHARYSPSVGTTGRLNTYLKSIKLISVPYQVQSVHGQCVPYLSSPTNIIKKYYPPGQSNRASEIFFAPRQNFGGNSAKAGVNS